MLYLGIDPGLTGAIALLDRGGLLECADIPTCSNGQESGSMKRWVDAGGLRSLLSQWAVRHDFAGRGLTAAVERPIPMPSLPAQTIASQFDTFGVLRALVEARADTTQYPTPQSWKKMFGIGADKSKALATAAALYPDAPVNRVKDHNRAEAILIAHHLLRMA